MARLPQPGHDEGVWGNVLNTFLLTAHTTTGDLKDGIVNESKLDSTVIDKLNEPATIPDDSITEAKLAPALTATINNKSDIGHQHVIADVTGLQTALDAKAPTASLADVATSGDYGDLANQPLIGAYVIVLGSADPVPNDTPAGTVIIRTVS